MLEFEVEFWRLPLPKLADLGPVELKWFLVAWEDALELFPVQEVGPLLPPFRGDLLASAIELKRTLFKVMPFLCQITHSTLPKYLST